MAEELIGRVSVLENRVEDHQRLLNAQSEKNEILSRLSILMERQIEDSKEFKLQLQEFSRTLTNVNDNLTNLNINQQQMKQDMTEIGSRVTDIERHQEEHKVDVFSLVKTILSYLLTGIGSILLAWLLYKLGINNN